MKTILGTHTGEDEALCEFAPSAGNLEMSHVLRHCRRQNRLNISVKLKQFLHILDNFAPRSAEPELWFLKFVASICQQLLHNNGGHQLQLQQAEHQ